MIQEVALLSPDECLKIAKSVRALQSSWISRQRMLPFYTLGAASYLDAVATATQNYYTLAKETNPVLMKQFPWMYQRISGCLSESLEGYVKYVERFALPGFHILQGHEIFRQEFASLHFDLQYQLLLWEMTIEDYIPISFTLPIVLPHAGAGLWHWDVLEEELAGKSSSEKDKIIASRSKSLYTYKTGIMLVHSGHKLHQIAPIPEFAADEERVTLQGHGLLVDGTWHIYW